MTIRTEQLAQLARMSISNLSDSEIVELLRDHENPISRARREFSSACARIDQAGRQRSPLGPVAMRRMEFEAVQKIIEAYQGKK